VDLDAGAGVYPFFAAENGTATNGLTLRFGTFNSVTDADVEALGYNLLWVNNQFTIMTPSAGGTTTSTLDDQAGSFSSDGVDDAKWSTSSDDALSEQIWLVYSDSGTLTSSTQFGVATSSDSTWDMPAVYSPGTTAKDLYTANITTSAFGSTNGTAATSSVRTAVAPTTYLYWDSNTAAGLGGDGTWSSLLTDTEWTTNASGTATDGPYAWGTTSGTDYYAGAGLTANFTGTAGTVTVSGTVQTHKGIEISTTGYTLSSGTINLAGANATANTITVTTGTSTISSVLTGSNGLTKNGTGTLALSGANTYGENTQINAGALAISHADALGSTAAGTTVASGAALELSGGITIGAEPLNLTGTGISTGGALRNTSGTNSLSGAITLAGATRINSDAGTLTLSGGISGTQNLTFGGAGDTTVNSIIGTSTGTLTKDGAGTLTLSGANTYTGTTTVSVGTLATSAADRISDSSAISVSNGATFQLGGSETVGSIAGAGTFNFGANTLTAGGDNSSTTVSGTLSGTGAFVKTGSGLLTLSRNNSSTFTGTTTISGGGIVVASTSNVLGFGNITMAQDTSIGVSGSARSLTNNFTLTGNVTLGTTGTDGALTLGGTGRTLNLGSANRSITVSNTASATILDISIIGDSGIGFTKLGAGNLTFSRAGNNYSGATVVSDGTLYASGAADRMSSSSALIVESGATFGMSHSNTVASIAGAGNFQLGANTLTAGGDNTSTTVSGSISGTGGGLTKQGSGTFTLSGSNSYTGTTTLSAGGLNLNNADALGTSTLTIGANGVTLDNTSGSAITLSNNNVQNWNGNFTFTGTNDLNMGTGAVALNANRVVTVSAGTLTVGGVIANATSTARGLTKEGAGTLTLTGANTYSGATTINAGTLVLNGSNTASAITINSGTLAGTGSGGATTVAAGGRISPGGSSVGTLATTTLTLNGTGGYIWNITDATSGDGIGWDLINVGGGTGATTINANSDSRFTIFVNGNTPSNFTNTNSYAWNIIDWGTVTGFSASAFTVDASAFIGADPAATWSVANTAGYLQLLYTYATGTPTYSAGTGNWNGNFSPTLTNTSDAIFDGATGGTATATNNYAFGTIGTIGTLTFNSTAGAYTLAANSDASGFSTTQRLTIGDIENNSTATQTLNLHLNVTTAHTFNATAGDLVFGETIATAGTITLGGDNDFTLSGIVSGAGGLTKNGTGTATLSAANTFTGAIQVNQGTLATTAADTFANTANITVAIGATYSVGGSDTINSLTSPGSLTLSSGTLTISSSTADSSITGAISGSGNLTKAGSGTLTITNNNSSYSGITRLNGGVLEIGHNGALGTGNFTMGASGITIRSTDATDRTIANRFGTFAGSTAVYTFGSAGTGNLTFSDTQSASLGATRTFSINNTFTRFDGVFSGGGDGITKNGTGTMILTGANSYTGATTINAGILQIGNGGTTGSLSTSSTITNNAGLVFNQTDTVTQGTDFANNIGGTGTLTQNGSGILALNTSNSYSGGTSLSLGTLRVHHGNALGSGAVTQTGGTLQIRTSSAISNDMNLTNLALYNSSNLTGSITTGTTLYIETYNPSQNLISGNISGAGGLSISIGAGAASITLTGSNTYLGNTVLIEEGGILQIGNGGTTGSLGTAGSFTIGDRLVFNRSNTVTQGTDFANNISGTGSLTQNGTGTLILSANNTYTGATTINTGILQIGAGGTTGALSTSSTITNNAGLVFNQTDTVTQGTDFANNIGGTGTLTQNGSGTLALNTSNSYTGATTINTGIIRASNATALGTTAGGVTVASGAALELIGGITIGAEALNLSGTGISTGGALRNISGDNTYQGAITLAAATRINSDAGLLTLSGAIGGAGQNLTIGGAGNTAISNAIGTTTGTLTKEGAGTLTLSEANTYTGTTTISAGTLQIGAGGGTGSIASNAIVNNSALLVDRTGSLTLSGNMSGTGTLTKNGSGTLVLSGSNTYSGATTLNLGTLTLQTSNALGTSTLTQASAASLLAIDTTGTLTNTMSLYNVLAQQSATLSGPITVNNATFDVETGDTLTLSGGVGGTGGVTKNGTGTLVLSGSNTYSGATVINAGTLNAAHANALGTNAAVTVNGGSLLVSTDDAINSKNLILASTASGNGTAASLAFSGTYNGTAGTLTLNQNSIIDLGEGSVVIRFSDIVWGGSTTLDIYNWTGTTLWGGGDGDNTDQFYIDSALDAGELNRISFYSGLAGSSFVGTGYQLSGGSFNNEIIPVPEPETYATALLLLLGLGLYFHRQKKSARLASAPTNLTRPGE